MPLIEEITKNGYILTHGRYIAIAPEKDDGVPFKVKMKKLTTELKRYFKENKKLEKKILENLKKLDI